MALHQLLIVLRVVACWVVLIWVYTHILTIHGGPGHESRFRNSKLLHHPCAKGDREGKQRCVKVSASHHHPWPIFWSHCPTLVLSKQHLSPTTGPQPLHLAFHQQYPNHQSLSILQPPEPPTASPLVLSSSVCILESLRDSAVGHPNSPTPVPEGSQRYLRGSAPPSRRRWGPSRRRRPCVRSRACAAAAGCGPCPSPATRSCEPRAPAPSLSASSRGPSCCEISLRGQTLGSKGGLLQSSGLFGRAFYLS